MKPLRRVMKQLDIMGTSEAEAGGKKVNWSQQADPKTVPPLGQVTQEDIYEAMQSTKAAAKIVNHEKYMKWMENYGSV